MLEISTLKKILLIILTAIALLGCINKPKPVKHAYRITDVPQEVIIAIAKDAVAQMSVLFPSTKTQIRFTHVASDQFGLAFIDGLRTQGFSVKEHAPAQTLDQVLADHQEQQKHLNENINKAIVDKNGLIKLEEPDNSVPLSYLLDHTRDNHTITLTTGNLKSMRSYSIEGGELRPAGHWINKEP